MRACYLKILLATAAFALAEVLDDATCDSCVDPAGEDCKAVLTSTCVSTAMGAPYCFDCLTDATSNDCVTKVLEFLSPCMGDAASAEEPSAESCAACEGGADDYRCEEAVAQICIVTAMAAPFCNACLVDKASNDCKQGAIDFMSVCTAVDAPTLPEIAEEEEEEEEEGETDEEEEEEGRGEEEEPAEDMPPPETCFACSDPFATVCATAMAAACAKTSMGYAYCEPCSLEGSTSPACVQSALEFMGRCRDVDLTNFDAEAGTAQAQTLADAQTLDARDFEEAWPSEETCKNCESGGVACTSSLTEECIKFSSLAYCSHCALKGANHIDCIEPVLVFTDKCFKERPESEKKQSPKPKTEEKKLGACGPCVDEFVANDGCTFFRETFYRAKDYIPDGCDHCGPQAQAYCADLGVATDEELRTTYDMPSVDLCWACVNPLETACATALATACALSDMGHSYCEACSLLGSTNPACVQPALEHMSRCSDVDTSSVVEGDLIKKSDSMVDDANKLAQAVSSAWPTEETCKRCETGGQKCTAALTKECVGNLNLPYCSVCALSGAQSIECIDPVMTFTDKCYEERPVPTEPASTPPPTPMKATTSSMVVTDPPTMPPTMPPSIVVPVKSRKPFCRIVRFKPGNCRIMKRIGFAMVGKFGKCQAVVGCRADRQRINYANFYKKKSKCKQARRQCMPKWKYLQELEAGTN